MNISDLQTRLLKSNVPADAYSLTGGLPNEAYCIEQGTDGKWDTYYCERGQRTSLRTFDTETEACDYFFNCVKKLCV